MLAFMPQSPPPSVHESTSSNTMSLAILPSSAPMPYSQASSTTLLQNAPSPAKRPKLSLNTNDVPSIFGKTSTSLRLDTLSATSPTAKNTFKNAFDPAQSQRQTILRPTKPSLEPLSTDISAIDLGTSQSNTTTPVESASSSTSLSSVSTIDSLPEKVPYKLSYNTTSILSNSPLPRLKVRNTSFSQSKPMFPAAKKVTFRSPLTEEVKNVNFTLRHSDIESSTSTISTLELSPSEARSSTMNDEPSKRDSDRGDRTSMSPQTGDKRESSDEDDSDSEPQTPGPSGKRKRHRQWVWTLGPVQSPTKEISTNDANGPAEQHAEVKTD